LTEKCKRIKNLSAPLLHSKPLLISHVYYSANYDYQSQLRLITTIGHNYTATPQPAQFYHVRISLSAHPTYV